MWKGHGARWRHVVGGVRSEFKVENKIRNGLA